MEAKIDGIGTLRNTVVAGPEPAKGSGSQLPPVSSYPRPTPAPTPAPAPATRPQ